MENEDVVFKTILTDNAMKLMENEDVELFSHFDMVFNKGRKTSSGGGGAP